MMHLILKSSSQDFLGRQMVPQRLLLLCITAYSLAFSPSSSLTTFCFTFGILVTSTKWLGGQEVNWLPHMLLPLLVALVGQWGRGAEAGHMYVWDVVMMTQGKNNINSSLCSGYGEFHPNIAVLRLTEHFNAETGCFLSHSLLVTWWCSPHRKHVASWHWHLEAPFGYIILLCSSTSLAPRVLCSHRWSALRYFVCQPPSASLYRSLKWDVWNASLEEAWHETFYLMKWI